MNKTNEILTNRENKEKRETKVPRVPRERWVPTETTVPEVSMVCAAPPAQQA